jgi:hypothetical protein
MRITSIQDIDLNWLRDTHLRGVPLPAKYMGFQFAVLHGNEDAPHSLDLYVSKEPDYDDDYLRVLFGEPPVYCSYIEMDGKRGTPKWVEVSEADRQLSDEVVAAAWNCVPHACDDRKIVAKDVRRLTRETRLDLLRGYVRRSYSHETEYSTEAIQRVLRDMELQVERGKS